MRDLLLEKTLRHGAPPQGTVQVFALSLWKCFEQRYLARSFDEESKLQAFLHHYQFAGTALGAAGLQHICAHDVLLWSHEDFVITLKAENVITNEGEITLHFRRGAEALYGLSFSMVPAGTMGAPAGPAILIGRMQGARDKGEAIAHAARACGDISPQASLHCALQGIARALGIDRVFGVAAHNQVCFEAERAELFVKAYDSFYASVGGATKIGAGFHALLFGEQRRPLCALPLARRRRTRAKREAKDAITVSAERRFHAFTRERACTGAARD